MREEKLFKWAVIALLVCTISLSTLKATVLWNGDATQGTGIFKALNFDGIEGSQPTGTITAVNDATYGTVWQFYKPATDHRCEAHAAQGYQAAEGDVIYIGWRFKVSIPLYVTTNAFFQWKAYGDNMLQNYPITINSADDGRLHLIQHDPDGTGGKIRHDVWSAPFTPNTWISVVLKIKLSRDINVGNIEFWYNGAQQTLLGGSTTFTCRTFDAEYCDPKWGVYGGDGTSITNKVDDIKIATTYNEAAPSGTTTIPNAPSGTTATAVSGSRINLTWVDNSNNESGFVIRRSTDGTSFSSVDTVAANVTSYSNTGLASNTTYYYRIKAINQAGSSDYVNTASTTTLKENIALNKTATASNVYNNNATYNAAKAVDGSTTTRWATDNGITAATLEVTLGANYTFSSTIIREYGNRVTSYKVQYWNGSSWLDAYTGTTIGTAKTDNFTTVSGSKVRLNILSITGTSGPTIYEFEVYGSLKSALVTPEPAVSEIPEIGISPNPVKDRATISYSVPNAAPVKIDMLSVTGQLSKTFINEFREAGNYKLEVNASDLHGGLYIIRLSSGKSIQTIKTLVIK